MVICGLINPVAKGIVSGCTEIPLLIHQSDVRIPSFNTPGIHTKTAVDFMLDE